MRPPAVCFVARSGTGKTTLLELVRRGHRVGAVKHHAHDFDIDRPGKDSHRLAAAGSAVTVISSPDRLALVRRGSEPSLEEILGRYFGEVDLVLVEGYKEETLPKIEIHRAAIGGPLLTRERSPTRHWWRSSRTSRFNWMSPFWISGMSPAWPT